MTIKVGDMVLIISPLGRKRILLGSIAEVLALDPSYPFDLGRAPGAYIRLPRKAETTSGKLQTDGWVRQSNLRPISGLPDNEEIQDEKPIKETA